MKLEKKKRLEAAGWRVGTVSEFLGLTDEEAVLIELKLDLARAVRTERVRRRLPLPPQLVDLALPRADRAAGDDCGPSLLGHLGHCARLLLDGPPDEKGATPCQG